MENLEQLKTKLQELSDERQRLLRGFGQRYSRRFKPVAFDRRVHGTHEKYAKIISDRTNRAKSNIARAKVRLVQLSDEISALKSKIQGLELLNTKSSPQFNSTYKDAIGQF